jgi:rRNA-processing protein FCF1
MQHMNVLMDADCLIKLTKAGLKEAVCAHLSVTIPQIVKHEVVDLGKNHPDSTMIKDNLGKGLLSLSGVETPDGKGEEAALAIFQRGGFDAVCSDDKRFIRRLRVLDVPYITPAVCVFLLLKQGKINLPDALEKLELLRPFISSDEYHTVKWALDTWRSP